MLLIKEVEKYDTVLENYKDTLSFLLNEICYNKLSKHRKCYIKIFNMLTGGNYDEEHKNCTRKHWQQKCAEHCVNEMLYKSRIDKAVEYIENDLKSFLYSIEYKTLLNILNGGDE